VRRKNSGRISVTICLNSLPYLAHLSPSKFKSAIFPSRALLLSRCKTMSEASSPVVTRSSAAVGAGVPSPSLPTSVMLDPLLVSAKKLLNLDVVDMYTG
jgi:hypothetical protein